MVPPSWQGRRSPRVLAALALLLPLPLLGSCFTYTLWQVEHRIAEHSAPDTPAAWFAGDDSSRPAGLAVAPPTDALRAIGWAPAAGSSWVLLYPDHASAFAPLIEAITNQPPFALAASVTFQPSVDHGPRVAWLRLRAEWRDELDRTGVTDVRDSRQEVRIAECSTSCRWRMASAAPPGASALPECTVIVQDLVPDDDMGTATRVLLTPFTVVLDAALLPLQLLGAGLVAWVFARSASP